MRRMLLQGRRLGFDSWVRKIPWKRQCNSPQHSCLENPMDSGAWRATELDPAERLSLPGRKDSGPLLSAGGSRICFSHAVQPLPSGPGDALRRKRLRSRGAPSAPHSSGTRPEPPHQQTQFCPSLLITQPGISDCSSNCA